MKEYINKLLEIAKAFVMLSGSKDAVYMDDYVSVWFGGGEEPIITIDGLVVISIFTKYTNIGQFQLNDVSRIDEIPSIIGKCEEWLDNNKTIKHD